MILRILKVNESFSQFYPVSDSDLDLVVNSDSDLRPSTSFETDIHLFQKRLSYESSQAHATRPKRTMGSSKTTHSFRLWY